MQRSEREEIYKNSCKPSAQRWPPLMCKSFSSQTFSSEIEISTWVIFFLTKRELWLRTETNELFCLYDKQLWLKHFSLCSGIILGLDTNRNKLVTCLLTRTSMVLNNIYFKTFPCCAHQSKVLGPKVPHPNLFPAWWDPPYKHWALALKPCKCPPWLPSSELLLRLYQRSVLFLLKSI